jgi:hypothetical protein
VHKIPPCRLYTSLRIRCRSACAWCRLSGKLHRTCSIRVARGSRGIVAYRTYRASLPRSAAARCRAAAPLRAVPRSRTTEPRHCAAVPCRGTALQCRAAARYYRVPCTVHSIPRTLYRIPHPAVRGTAQPLLIADAHVLGSAVAHQASRQDRWRKPANEFVLYSWGASAAAAEPGSDGAAKGVWPC